MSRYAALLGGRAFEPNEENPMLGFRGAARSALAATTTPTPPHPTPMLRYVNPTPPFTLT